MNSTSLNTMLTWKQLYTPTSDPAMLVRQISRHDVNYARSDDYSVYNKGLFELQIIEQSKKLCHKATSTINNAS